MITELREKCVSLVKLYLPLITGECGVTKTVVILVGILMITALPSLADAEQGVASYYADSLHGNPTASGEPYDKDKLTAAHRSLPFGTRVKVTNLDNGKSVVVLINDRGPHVKSRVIDVSGAAAIELGLLDSGTASVDLEVVD
jgi:rare lipoprotein A